MPLTYCTCATAGRIPHLSLDAHRPGKYICNGCGAPEEAVFATQRAMDEDWAKYGKGPGHIPESLMAPGTIITDEPGGPKVLPYKEMYVEGQKDSGRSLAELVRKHKEIAAAKGVDV